MNTNFSFARVLNFGVLISAVLFPACSQESESSKAHAMNALLGTGVNLGNALEAASDWDWTLPLEKRFFPMIKAQGFDSVRIPIRWSGHAAQEAPYTIDETFFAKVDWAIEQALENDLVVLINMHHYLELFQEPASHTDRFLGLWKQIALRYRDLPETVFFEPLNEPNTNLTPEAWNGLIPQVIDVIRESNPDRMLVIDVAHWSNVEYTPRLQLPEEDRNLIVSFHYYSPHAFTHQSTPWSEPQFRDLSGIEWLGTEAEKAKVTEDLMIAVNYANQVDRPLYLGEFGAYSAADMESRIRWTTWVAEEARRLGMTLGYWEFGASFGLYDLETDAWREGLLQAVLP